MVAEIAVLGAGGGTGQKCVEKLLEQQKSVKAIVRDATKYKEAWPSNDKLYLVNGDVTDAASIESTLQGVKGIIFAVSASTYFGANAVDRDVGLQANLGRNCSKFLSQFLRFSFLSRDLPSNQVVGLNLYFRLNPLL